jgi:hypothetical protein
MAQHLVDGRVAVIAAGEEAGDSGDLVCFPSARGQFLFALERFSGPNDSAL